MADLLDGLEQQEQAAQTALETTVQTETQNDDLAAIRGIFDGIPEDWDRAQLQQWMTELQQKAEEAEQLRQQKADYERLLAAQVQQASQPAQTQTTQQVAQQEAAKRRYEAAKQVEPALKPYLSAEFVTQDQFGNYVPLVDPKTGVNRNLDANVVAACRQMNESLRSRQRVLEDFTNDPYEIGNELLTKSPAWTAQQQKLAEMEAKLAGYEKLIEEKINPLQQFTDEQKLSQIIGQNMDLLTTPDPTAQGGIRYSVAGEQYMRLVAPTAQGGAGIAPLAALELVKPLANARLPELPKPKPQPKTFMGRLTPAAPHLNRGGAVAQPPVQQPAMLNNWDDLMNAVFTE